MNNKKKIASLSGQAGALRVKAEKKLVECFLPYTSKRDVGVCDVCQQRLKAPSPYNVTPHTPSTCPGVGARTMMGGGQ